MSAELDKLLSLRAESAVAFARAASLTAAGLVQLRAHERGVEGHDDIVVILREKVLAQLVLNYKAAAAILRNAGDCSDVNYALTVVDKMLTLPYATDLKLVLDAHAPAFTKSQAAVALLGVVGIGVKLAIDDSFRRIVAMRTALDYTRNMDQISEKEAVDIMLAMVASINMYADRTATAVDTIFDLTSDKIDDIARQENAYYLERIDVLKEPASALLETNKKFAGAVSTELDRLHKIAYPEKHGV